MKKTIIRADGIAIKTVERKVAPSVNTIAQAELPGVKYEAVPVDVQPGPKPVLTEAPAMGPVYEKEPVAAEPEIVTEPAERLLDTVAAPETTGEPNIDALIEQDNANSWTLMGVTMKKFYWILMASCFAVLLTVLLIVAIKN